MCDTTKENSSFCLETELVTNQSLTLGLDEEETPPTFEHALLFLLLIFFSMVTISGNLLVIAAVLRERTLHTATNYFITSLAVSDCLVGLVVMPFSATYEAMGQKWIFGSDWCDVWHSFDVLGSTASILNLCVISLDRYWAITDPMTYPAKMTDTKAGVLIFLVWICSSAISFPAIAWWRATAIGPPPVWQCKFTEDIGYLFFSSTVSFYGPLTVMVFTYVRVYKAAVEHTKSLRIGAKQLGNSVLGNGAVTLRMHRGGGANGASQNSQSRGENPASPSLRLRGMVVSQNFNFSRKLAKFAKEKKAAKTLGTVMGIFIICWFPFFLVNVISGLLSSVQIPEIVFQVVTWLGWLNSSMNPFIYACCSKDFRRAFTRIICCQFSRRRSSSTCSSWHKVSSKKYQVKSYSLPCLSKTSNNKKVSNCQQNNYYPRSIESKKSNVLPSIPQEEPLKKQNSKESHNSISVTSSPEILFSFKMKGKVFKEQQGANGETSHEGAQVEIQKDIVVFHRQVTQYSLYEIPPPNYNCDPMVSREKLL